MIRYFKTYVNHVFQLHETEFEFANHDGAEVIKSKRPGAYWECRRGRNNTRASIYVGCRVPLLAPCRYEKYSVKRRADR